MLIKVAVTAS